MKQNYPKSRTDEIVVQELNGEILVYDLRDNRAMALNETSAAVWRACDGSNSVADIAKKVGNEDIVWLALSELKKERLLDLKSPISNSFEAVTRRDVIRKIGLGSMIALPLISGLVAPPAAHAQSCGQPCNPGTNPCPVGSACPTCSSGSNKVCIQ